MHLANEVKTVAAMILQKLYDLSVGYRMISPRLDLLFVELNNEAPAYIQRSLFDSALSFAVYRSWIEYGETDNEVRITPDGCNEISVYR
ncbi:MAG: hypothetical protein ACM3SR_06510 [Ignavibacteriales bacterium]